MEDKETTFWTGHRAAVLDQVFEDLAATSLAIARSKGFEPGPIAESVALFHSECSEVLEDARAGHLPTEVWYETKRIAGQAVGVADTPEKETHVETTEVTKYWEPGPGRKPCGIPSELADIIIRVAHFAGHHGIDLGKAIREKAEYNQQRAHMHGKKF